MEPTIQAFFDKATFTISYLVWDPATRGAAVIDPVLDYAPNSGRTGATSAQAILDAANKAGLAIDWILETHAHADHLSAAAWLAEKTGAKIAIGEHIVTIQKTFRPIFNAKDVAADGTPFDRLLKDGERIALGGLAIEVLYTPGHTPACVSYKIGNNVFVGDTLFMPDYGTARADFPGGDASALYHSIRRLLSLPPETVLWMCHDYGGPGRTDYAWKTTVADERARNVQIHDGVSEKEFVATRQARDRTLAMPVLILPSIQVNIRAGEMPPKEDDGNTYLKIPVNRIGKELA
jgi:glyoxylase-like metal-dependent hydrolase (beta-lactamase superfamily II)